MERWPSGRRHSPAKRVGGASSLEGSNPSLSAPVSPAGAGETRLPGGREGGTRLPPGRVRPGAPYPSSRGIDPSSSCARWWWTIRCSQSGRCRASATSNPTRCRALGPSATSKRSRPADDLHVDRVDPLVLAHVLLPRAQAEGLGHASRVLEAAVQAPAEGPGAQAHPPQFGHGLQELAEAALVDGPGVEHHHRPAGELGIAVRREVVVRRAPPEPGPPRRRRWACAAPPGPVPRRRRTGRPPQRGRCWRRRCPRRAATRWATPRRRPGCRGSEPGRAPRSATASGWWRSGWSTPRPRPRRLRP